MPKIDANREELETNKLNSLILHSSDAHKLERVGKTYLWIKADPTFSGLKQVLNEPKARVFIGDTFPNYKPDHKVIKKILIPKSNGWFKDDFELELNRDLVAIIGGRGSGKSALAEMIAYGAGSEDQSVDAFLKKATKHKNSIKGVKVNLEWNDNEKTEFEVGALNEDCNLVRYLPQGAVERLCSPDNSKDLQEQIENVIFQALDETEKMGASKFTELRERILVNFQFEKEQIQAKITNINAKIKAVLDAKKDLPDKKKSVETKKIELKKLNSSLPELLPADKEGQEELASLLELKKLFDEKIINLGEVVEKINKIETKVKLFGLKIKEFEEGIDALLGEAEIADKEAFTVNLKVEDIDKILAKKRNEVAEKIKTLREGGKTEVEGILGITLAKLKINNLSLLNDSIDKKRKETKAYETIKIKYQQQKKTIGDLENTIVALEKEISTTQKEIMPEEEKLRLELSTSYCSYFIVLKNEKEEIEKLYQPLQVILSGGTDTDRKLDFDAKISYNLDQHYLQGLTVLNRTRKGNFREETRLKKSLLEMWENFSREDFSEEAISNNLKTITKGFTELEGKEILIKDQLRQDFSEEDFLNWLFNPSYFKIVSSLKFDGTDLDLLSPGQKGIVLLMLYLEVDKEDYRPLIIDQPEENLDNLSVCNDLITFFRDRKSYRQIIVVTHNPNLVVNTDAEQVIVANYDGRRTPRLEYAAGSLEDQAKKIPAAEIGELEDGIIEQVCAILEGGERAFENRKKKYQISSKNFQG